MKNMVKILCISAAYLEVTNYILSFDFDFDFLVLLCIQYFSYPKKYQYQYNAPAFQYCIAIQYCKTCSSLTHFNNNKNVLSNMFPEETFYLELYNTGNCSLLFTSEGHQKLNMGHLIFKINLKLIK